MISLVLEVYGAIIVINLILAVIFSILSDIASTKLSELNPYPGLFRRLRRNEIPEQNPKRINPFKHIRSMF
jgi:hypothetical protein